MVEYKCERCHYIAKQKGDYKLADKIRVELASKGVIIEDKKEIRTFNIKFERVFVS